MENSVALDFLLHGREAKGTRNVNAVLRVNREARLARHALMIDDHFAPEGGSFGCGLSYRQASK